MNKKKRTTLKGNQKHWNKNGKNPDKHTNSPFNYTNNN